MNFYTVEPIDSLSYSRRWYVDDIGLEIVKDKYVNYNKDPLHVVNRWNEFKVEEANTVLFDFGGMLRIGTPIIRELVFDTQFELMVTHIPILLEALDSERLLFPKYWKCGTRFYSYIFSLEVKDKLKKLFKKKKDLYNEMIEGFNKEMDKVVEQTNGKVITLKPYHQGGENV
jgi:hypothetical protein